MKQQHRMRKGLLVGLLAAVALAGCGSGSSQDKAAGTVDKAAVEAIFNGTIEADLIAGRVPQTTEVGRPAAT
jgi:hypothetical protein